MKILIALISVAAMFLFSGTCLAANPSVGEITVNATPGGQPPRICIDSRDMDIGGGPSINIFDYRTSLYAFTGEQIEYIAVVRNPTGAVQIGFLKALINQNQQALGVEIPLASVSDRNCDGLGRLDPSTDKAFRITITVGSTWYNLTNVTLAVYDSNNTPTPATHSERWFFNPALSMKVNTSDGKAISFEQLPYGAETPEERTIHSLNKIQVTNDAEGGVNMWMFVAGTDIYSPGELSLCPTTNRIEIMSRDFDGDGSNELTHSLMQYRGWSGTQWPAGEGWEDMNKYDINDACVVWGTCYGGVPVPKGIYHGGTPLDNVLTNRGTLEMEFKLTYPLPCFGSFTNGTIYVLGKAI